MSDDRPGPGLKAKNQNRLLNLVAATILLLILAVSAKSCVVTVWSPSDTIEAYSVVGEDARQFELLLLPDREVLIRYDSVEGEELVRARARGTYGTHYLGGLWNVESRGPTAGLSFLLGFRLIPSPIRPVDMELTIQTKRRVGSQDSAFPPEGQTVRSVLLFSADSVKFEEMWLRRSPVDRDRLMAIRTVLDRQ